MINKTTILKSGVGMSKTIPYGQKEKTPLNPLSFKKVKRTNKENTYLIDKIPKPISQKRTLNFSKPLKIAKNKDKITKKPNFKDIISIKHKLSNLLYIKYLENVIKILLRRSRADGKRFLK